MNVLGKSIFAYLGVNYAEAPVDKLRFKKPIPIAVWNDKPMLAKKFGKACLQVPSSLNQSTSSMLEFGENCLNLNIWTPCNGQNNPLPVLFFIHGNDN